jgi:hypothetical protein
MGSGATSVWAVALNREVVPAPSSASKVFHVRSRVTEKIAKQIFGCATARVRRPDATQAFVIILGYL